MTGPAAPQVGDTVTFAKTMTVAEQAMFTAISGNLGALYVDRRQAQSAGLADMAVFELAATALLTTCLSRMAGPGYRIAELSIRLDRALCVGETVQAQATLVEQRGEVLHTELALLVEGRTIADGTATLSPVAGGGTGV